MKFNFGDDDIPEHINETDCVMMDSRKDKADYDVGDEWIIGCLTKDAFKILKLLLT